MKMCFYLLMGIVFTTVVSCSGNTDQKEETPETHENGEVKNLPFEERVEGHLRGNLNIPGTEKLDFQVYKAHLNADNQEDAIITLNRIDQAKNNTKDLKNSEQLKSFGYIGPYNFFVYYDGQKDKFSKPVPINSSASTPLKIEFENVYSDTYKTLIIQYRVSNAAFKNFYFIQDDIMDKVFQVKTFDYIGSDKPESFTIEYDKGSISSAKNILVYKGKITNYKLPIEDIFTYEPEIEKTGTLDKTWFYSPENNGYMTYDPDFDKK